MSQISKWAFSLLPPFVETGLWLLQDAFGRYKIGIIFATMLGFIGVTLQVGSVLLLHTTSNYLSQTGDIEISQLSITLNRTNFFYLAGGAVLIMLFLSALFRYFYRRRSIFYWRMYQLALNEKILNATTKAVNEGRIDGDKLQWDSVYKSVMLSGVRRLALLFRNLILSLESVIKFVLYLFFSLYINAGLTLLLFTGAIIVGLIVVLKFGRNSSKQMRSLQKKNIEATYQWRNLTEMTFHGEKVILENIDDSSQPIGIFLTTFQARFIDIEKSQLTAKIIMIILLLITLATYGGAALNGSLPWSDLIAALIAIIMTMVSLSAIAGTAAVFGRFYPEVEKYRMFINALKNSKNHNKFIKQVAFIAAAGDDLEEDDV